MTDALIQHVSEAAHSLVEDLEIARQTSGDSGQADRSVAAAMDKCLASLTSTGIWGVDNRLPSGPLWKIAGPLLQRGWLQTRAKTKPLGYAGDWLMITRIFDRFESDDPLGRSFDRYFQSQDAPEAVRRRLEMAAQEIVEHVDAAGGNEYHLVSVGSGPGIEIEQAFRQGRGPAHVTLLELDQEALDEARARLEAWLQDPQLVCRRENLFRLPARANKVLPSGSADFVLCLGLLDYLADREAIAFLAMLFEALRPGGRMLVGNFGSNCKARGYMEWFGNWYLIYRSTEELEQLALAAGIPRDAFQITAEATGVNLLLRAESL